MVSVIAGDSRCMDMKRLHYLKILGVLTLVVTCLFCVVGCGGADAAAVSVKYTEEVALALIEVGNMIVCSIIIAGALAGILS